MSTATEHPARPARQRYDEQFAARIIEQIIQGTAPWMKPWKPGEHAMPYNLESDKPYRGSNLLYLASAQIDGGYDCNAWATFRQINEVGGHVRKGEKGSSAVWWQFEKKVGKDENGKPIYERLDFPWFRIYTVFNLEQAEDVDMGEHAAGPDLPGWDRHEAAEELVRGAEVPVLHRNGDSAHYNLTKDHIVLPRCDQFEDRDRYYGTLLHELAHSTGHPVRLDRETLTQGTTDGRGSAMYAREELRAEIASMMLGDELGVGYVPDQQEAYVAGWIAALEDDPSEIRRAATAAEKIKGWITTDPQERTEEVT